MRFTSTSIPLKSSAYLGSSFFTSSECINKFSRKAQRRWTSPARALISEIFARDVFHLVHSTSKKPTKRLESIADTCCWFSSSISIFSSFSLNIYTSDPLWMSKLNLTSFQVSFNLARVFSILASCFAWSVVSSTSSLYLTIFKL